VNSHSLLLPLGNFVPSAILEIRYATAYNFVGQPIDGYKLPLALVTKEAGEALARAAELADADGLIFRVYDAYRPARAVAHFVRWAEDTADIRMKDVFYPAVDKSRLFELGFIASRSGHSRGSTIDLTLVNRKTGENLDMGGFFDEFGENAHHGAAKTESAAANRLLLKSIMEQAGFGAYDGEWWHYTLKNEPFPHTYFDIPVE